MLLKTPDFRFRLIRNSGLKFLNVSPAHRYKIRVKYAAFHAVSTSIKYERIGLDIDLVVVLLNGLATLTESELKTGLKLTEPEKFLLNLD